MQARYPTRRELLPEMLTGLTEEITKHADDAILINRLKVCSEEILTNIVDYSGAEEVKISCEYLAAADALRFEFIDDGARFDPLEEKPSVDISAELDERSIGGLGIYLYTTIMDEVEYRYEGGKNHLVAVKYLGKGG